MEKGILAIVDSSPSGASESDYSIMSSSSSSSALRVASQLLSRHRSPSAGGLPMPRGILSREVSCFEFPRPIIASTAHFMDYKNNTSTNTRPTSLTDEEHEGPLLPACDTSRVRMLAVGTITLRNKYFNQELTVVVVLEGNDTMHSRGYSGYASNASDYNQLIDDDDDATSQSSEEEEGQGATLEKQARGRKMRKHTPKLINRNEYERIGSSSDSDCAEVKEDDTAPTSMHATYSAAVTAVPPLPLSSLGPVIGVVVVCDVPNYRIFSELDAEELNANNNNISKNNNNNNTQSGSNDNTSVSGGDAIVDDYNNNSINKNTTVPSQQDVANSTSTSPGLALDNMSLTNRRRRLLQQQRDCEASTQRMAAEQSISRATAMVSDLNYAQAVLGCMQSKYSEGHRSGSLLTTVKSVCSPLATSSIDSQIQMRALALVSSSSSSPTTPAYVLDAWHDVCLTHYHELIEVDASVLFTCTSRQISGDNDRGSEEEERRRRRGDCSMGGESGGIVRIGELLCETPWPMGVKAWGANMSAMGSAVEKAITGPTVNTDTASTHGEPKGTSSRSTAVDENHRTQPLHESASSETSRVPPTGASFPNGRAPGRSPSARGFSKCTSSEVALCSHDNNLSSFSTCSPPERHRGLIFVTISDATDLRSAQRAARELFTTSLGMLTFNTNVGKSDGVTDNHAELDPSMLHIAFYVLPPRSKMSFNGSGRPALLLVPVVVVDSQSLFDPTVFLSQSNNNHGESVDKDEEVLSACPSSLRHVEWTLHLAVATVSDSSIMLSPSSHRGVPCPSVHALSDVAKDTILRDAVSVSVIPSIHDALMYVDEERCCSQTLKRVQKAVVVRCPTSFPSSTNADGMAPIAGSHEKANTHATAKSERRGILSFYDEYHADDLVDVVRSELAGNCGGTAESNDTNLAVFALGFSESEGGEEEGGVSANFGMASLYSVEREEWVGGAAVAEWMATAWALFDESVLSDDSKRIIDQKADAVDGSHPTTSPCRSNNRVLVVLADVNSAMLWSSSTTPNMPPQINAAYKTSFFGTLGGAQFPFTVAPALSNERPQLSKRTSRRGEGNGVDEQQLDDSPAGAPFYYVANDVIGDVVTRAEYMRCLFHRRLVQALILKGKECGISGGEGGEEEEEEASDVLSFVRGKVCSCQSQYASVMVVVSSSVGAKEAAQWARRDVFPLYSTPSFESCYDDGVGDSDADNNEADDHMSVLPDAHDNATTALFLVVDTPLPEQANPSSQQADGYTYRDSCMPSDEKNLYGDYFLGYSSESCEWDGDDGASNVAPPSRNVEVVWLSDFITDLEADAQLHDNNVLTDSDRDEEENEDEDEEDNSLSECGTQRPIVSSLISPPQGGASGPAGSPSSSQPFAPRVALNKLLQQTLERSPWPTRQIDTAAERHDCVLTLGKQSLQNHSQAVSFGDGLSHTAMGAGEMPAYALTCAPPGPFASLSLPFQGCMPPAYLFYSPDSNKTEIILTKWSPRVEKRRGVANEASNSVSNVNDKDKGTRFEDLTAIPDLAMSPVMDKLLREALFVYSSPITTRVSSLTHEAESTGGAQMGENACPTTRTDGLEEGDAGCGASAAPSFRFPLERYVSHDYLASLMRRVKEKGNVLPPEERERQAAILAEALGNLMVDEDEVNDEDDLGV